jgi:hypothetical protein
MPTLVYMLKISRLNFINIEYYFEIFFKIICFLLQLINENELDLSKMNIILKFSKKILFFLTLLTLNNALDYR